MMLSTLGWTTVFCLAIAVLLWVLGVSESFGSSLGISLWIGWSILGVNVFGGPALERRFGAVSASALATALGLVVAFSFFAFYFSQAQRSLDTLDWSSIALALFFGVLGTIVFTNLARVYEMREDLAKAEAQHQATERQLAQAQLKTLQAQIEPHFLFNTLSAAMGLIRTDPAAAEETLQQLTTLLRNSLSRTRTSHTSLGEEFVLLRAYLKIASIRMGERLDYTVQHEPGLEDAQLPPMLVQPLVENALTHGLEPAEAGGHVSISAQQTAGTLEIVITDTGLGLQDAPATQGNNTGLRNVRDRLQSLFGEEASLRLTANSPTGVIATLRLPNGLVNGVSVNSE